MLSTSQSTGVNITQLSNVPSSFTGIVRFFRTASVSWGPCSKIQSVLQWCGKFMPVNTCPITSKATNKLGTHSMAIRRFWNKPNSPISLRICPKLFMLLSDVGQRAASEWEKMDWRATRIHSLQTNLTFDRLVNDWADAKNGDVFYDFCNIC